MAFASRLHHPFPVVRSEPRKVDRELHDHPRPSAATNVRTTIATHPVFRYGLAAAAVLVMHALQMALDLPMSAGAPFLLYLGVVVLVAWTCGAGPGGLATLIATGLVYSRLNVTGIGPPKDLLLVGIFTIEGLAASAVSGLRARAERMVRTRARQHAAVAELGRRTLENQSLVGLLQSAVTQVAEAMAVDLVEILEVRPDGTVARTSAGSGLEVDGVPPQRTDLASETPDAGALLTDVAEDLGSLSGARRLAEHGAASGIGVPIEGSDGPFGTLSAYTRRRRRFTRGDVDFLRSIANLLTTSLRRRAAELEAERVRSHDALLAEASAALANSLDFGTRAVELTRTLVPRFADWCVVDLADDSGGLRRVAVEHADPARAETVRRSSVAGTLEWRPGNPIRIAMRTGCSQLITDDAELLRLGRDAPDLGALQRTGKRGLMCIPLQVGGRTLGVLSMGGAPNLPEFARSDLHTMEELASRAAMALDHTRLYQETVASDRAKDEFLVVLAHELRNPLAPMVHSLEILKLAGDAPAARERAQKVLGRQVAHMGLLVRDLLDVARISRGQIVLRREPVLLASAIANALETSLPIIEARRHRFVTHVPRAPIWLDADPVRLEQILTNLTRNAVQYSEPGARSDLFVNRIEDQVEIRIRDHGEGISAAVLPQVFNLFRRGESPGPGTMGIGLYLVRQLIELHGGNIEAKSDGPGKGSEFIVRLPVRPEPKPQGVEASSSTEPMHSWRVLVVDDHMDSAAALSELLVLWGHEVRTAVDGPEALATARAMRPELVFLDLAMPGMNGYQVARELRHMPELAGTTLVALTGYTHETARSRIKEAGFDHHLVKPMDPVALRRFIAELARDRSHTAA